MAKNTGRGSRVGDPKKKAAIKKLAQDNEQAKLNKATYEYGVIEGRRQMKVEVLSLLESRYLADDAPARGTEGSQAILNLAADISTEVKVISEKDATFE